MTTEHVEMEDLKPFRVVLRAPSRASFMPDENFVIESVAGRWGPVRVEFWTAWEEIGLEAGVPRDLMAEVSGPAPALDDALAEFPSKARMFGPMIAFVANVEVGMVDVELAFDASPDAREREYIQVFQAAEGGLPRMGRIIDLNLLLAFVEAVDHHPEFSRLNRALGHYDLALGHWYLGGESLSVGHLFMATEALTKAIARHIERTRNVSEEDLASELGVEPGSDRWKSKWEAALRLRDVFHGDEATYHAAKQASDGLEHGYLEQSEVHRLARQATERTFEHVRLAILELLGIDSQTRDDLMSRAPKDTRSLRKLVRGRFIGESEDLAQAGHRYPYLEWKSTITKLHEVERRHFSASYSEQMTIHCADGVSFQGEAYELHGRVPEGHQPIDLGPIELTPGAREPEGEREGDSFEP